MPRIAVGGFSHETNTFAPKPTDYAEFEAEGIRSGSQILEFSAYQHAGRRLCRRN